MVKKWAWALGAGAIALAAALPVQAATINAVANGNWDSDIWDNNDGDTDVNPGLRPGSSDTGYTTGTAGREITLTSDIGTVSAYLSRSNGGLWTIESGANMIWTGSTTIAESAGAGAIFSSANMTGGTITGGASSNLKVARTSSTGSATGTFTQSGGTVTTQNLILTEAASTGSETGTYNLQDTGVLNIKGNLDAGPGTAAFNFTGGTLAHNGLKMDLANAGGMLAVGGVDTVGTSLLKGSAGTDVTGFDYTQASGVISIDIASDSSYDQLLGTGITSGTNNVSLAGTLRINVLDGANLTDGTTFNIVVTGNIADSSIVDNTTLQVVGLTTGSFTKAIVPGTGDSDILQLTYTVPEPGSLSLLAVGSLGLLHRHRTSRPSHER